MKKLITLCLCIPLVLSAQNYINIATDPQGDDFSSNVDAESLEYKLSAAKDTLFVKISHYSPRSGDFGYALALDTNNVPSDGTSILQHNLKSQTPNNDMTYDVMFFAYENSFFPGIILEAYINGGVSTMAFGFDTSNVNYAVFAIPMAAIGNPSIINILGFVGSFDISPTGAGPSDVIPDTQYATAIPSTISVKENKLENTIYPNPASDFIQLGYEGNLIIKDIIGKTVGHYVYQKSDKLNIQDLSPGVYILQTDQGKYLGKVQKL